ncbi:MaoC family dehydratase N-terminal domain-containing protein [Nevskia sp.]|uniref:FAS1-like dehydratase domain-containing protein n=1 Tax=Nevskia sp. TaxID=1929292 RepID=UPI0025E27735|nr:MaoC family dehydratase N-terminal domain-containing protein [Nevskia sp.]
MTSATERSAVGTALGSYEQAREWIGRRSKTRQTDVAVDESRCKLFAALSEDSNPAYWDRQWATAQFGAPLAPSGLTMSLIMPLPWKPGGGSSSPPSLAVEVPLPGQTFINVDTDCEFLRPILWGDHFSVYEEIVHIGPEKTTRLGCGHFVTTCMNLLDAQGRLVARLTNVLYRYEAAPA